MAKTVTDVNGCSNVTVAILSNIICKMLLVENVLVVDVEKKKHNKRINLSLLMALPIHLCMGYGVQ